MDGDGDSSNIQPRQSLSDKQFWAGVINIVSSDLEPLEALLEIIAPGLEAPITRHDEQANRLWCKRDGRWQVWATQGTIIQ
jgi:hypothetical protein